MPLQPPPANPPSPPPQIIYQPVPISTTGNNSNSNGSNADSESRSISGNEISNQNTNVQVNSTSNVVKNRGLELPQTTLTLSGYYNSGGGYYSDNYGIVAAINIPLGNRGSSAVKAQMEAESRQAIVTQSSQLASTCRAIAESGVIIDYTRPEFQPIASCQYVKLGTKVIAQAPPVVEQIDYRAELEKIRQENQKLKEDLARFNRRVETTTPVPVEALW